MRRGEHLGPRVDTMVNIRSTWVLLPSLIKRARLSREILEQHLICRSGCPRKQPEMKEGRGTARVSNDGSRSSGALARPSHVRRDLARGKGVSPRFESHTSSKLGS